MIFEQMRMDNNYCSSGWGTLSASDALLGNI
jgi:hypothetical protein